MDNMTKKIIDVMKYKFGDKDVVTIPAQRGASFTAQLSEDGIYVSNLGNQPFLPWEVLTEAIRCLKAQEGRVAKRGDAMKYKLGEGNLQLAFE